MKKIFLILFILVNVFSLEQNDKTKVLPLLFVNIDVLNIKEKPDLSSQTIGLYTNGEAVEVINKQNGWIETKDGYIPSKFVFFIKPKLNSAKKIIRIQKEKLLLRKEPSKNGEILGFLTKGQRIYSLNKKGNWIKTPYGYITLKDTSFSATKSKKIVKKEQTVKLKIKKIAKTKLPAISLKDPIIKFSQKAYLKLEKEKIKKIKFNFETYLVKLLQSNKEYDNSYLNHKLTRLKNLISQDKYNFDFYFRATIGHNRDISDTGSFTDKSNINSELVLTKRLYDGQKNYTYNKKAFLEKRLSQLEHLKTKEKVILLGLDIYTNLLLAQEQIKIQKKVQKYKQSLLNNLNKRAKVLKVIDLDRLSLQNEILDIEKNLIILKQTYKTYTHIFRQSIDLAASGRLMLDWFDVSKSTSNLHNLKKMAVTKNSNITISQNKLKLMQADIVMQHSRKDWEIDFSATAGHKKTKSKEGSNRYSANGTAWNTALVFKYPIYERNDITLNVQKAKIETLQSKNILNMQQKETLNLVERKFNEYNQYNKLHTILKKQSKILTQSKEGYKKRYLLGVGTYKDFSEELTKHLSNENDFLINSVNVRKAFIELSILTGDSFFGK